MKLRSVRWQTFFLLGCIWPITVIGVSGLHGWEEVAWFIGMFAFSFVLGWELGGRVGNE